MCKYITIPVFLPSAISFIKHDILCMWPINNFFLDIRLFFTFIVLDVMSLLYDTYDEWMHWSMQRPLKIYLHLCLSISFYIRGPLQNINDYFIVIMDILFIFILYSIYIVIQVCTIFKRLKMNCNFIKVKLLYDIFQSKQRPGLTYLDWSNKCAILGKFWHGVVYRWF